MIIIQDSREKLGLTFNHPWITAVRIEKLDVGDYGAEFIDGHKPSVYFERKSIGDLYGTLSSGYLRFKNCIKRAQDSGKTLFIIVEGTLTKVSNGYDRSQISGTSMLYKLFTIWVRHGVQTIFTKDRREMAEYITQMYIACGKQYVKNKKT